MYVGADLGAGHARAARVENGTLCGPIVERNHSGRNALDALDDAIAEAGDGYDIAGIGIGIPGLYNGTILTASGNLTELEGTDFDRYSAPAALLHDITALRIGEELYGRAQGFRSVTAMNFGSGFSLCFSDKAGEEYRSWCEDDQHRCTREFYRKGRPWAEMQRALGANDIMQRHRIRAWLRGDGVELTLEEMWRSNSREARLTQAEILRNAQEAVLRAEQIHHADIYVLGGGQSGALAPLLQERLPQLTIVASGNYVASAIKGAAYAAQHEKASYRRMAVNEF